MIGGGGGPGEGDANTVKVNYSRIKVTKIPSSVSLLLSSEFLTSTRNSQAEKIWKPSKYT